MSIQTHLQNTFIRFYNVEIPSYVLHAVSAFTALDD